MYIYFIQDFNDTVKLFYMNIFNLLETESLKLNEDQHSIKHWYRRFDFEFTQKIKR